MSCISNHHHQDEYFLLFNDSEYQLSINSPIFSLAMDVFMMIRRQKLTLFIDAKESSTVLELKRMIEGIIKVPTNNLRLIVDSTKQPMDDENQTLADCGLSAAVAKAYSPTLLYLCHRKTANENEWESIDVADLSTPPPLPEVFNKADEDKKDNTQIAS